MTHAPYHRTGTYWFVGDGYIWDNLPVSYRPASGRPLECSSSLLVYNPQAQDAHVVARFYHVNRTPSAVEFTVPAGRLHTMDLTLQPEIPHNQSFWTVVESDVPVYPQVCHADYTYWDPTPDALIAVAPYPGPLENETSWLLPDCYQGGPQSWYERETLTILNPASETVTARIRYLLRGRVGGGEEEIEIPGGRLAALEVWERHPRLLNTENGPPIRVQGDYAVRIDASGPVIAQSSRRARRTGLSSIVGSRSTMGVSLHEPLPKCWYYPGGYIAERGVLPRDENCDVTWNLLFTHNPSESVETSASVTFHGPDGQTTQSEPFVIPPLKSDLEWLHLAPWLETHTAINQPFAMTVAGEGPVVPEVTCAEFEMWSHVCPGAMSAVNFFPGPLEDEQVWWLGIAPAGGSDQNPVEWQQSYHLFNPGKTALTVTLDYLGTDGNMAAAGTQVVVPPNGVARAEPAAASELTDGQQIVVRASASAPFCAQTFVRALTRGLAPVRAMYSHMGVPISLQT